MNSARIRVKSRGALVVEGNFELLDEDGKPVDLQGRQKVALCRCGASAIKPFCDGSHNRVGFGAHDPPASGTPGPTDG